MINLNYFYVLKLLKMILNNKLSFIYSGKNRNTLLHNWIKQDHSLLRMGILIGECATDYVTDGGGGGGVGGTR